MQRILFALVALISFLAINLRPAQSQGVPGQAMEPTNSPQRIDQPAPNAEDEHGKSVETPTPGAEAHPVTGEAAPFVVPANTTVDSVRVVNQSLIVRGHVRGNVQAINSRVTIEPGARVDGKLILGNSGYSTAINLASLPPQSADISRAMPRINAKGRWFSSQFMLWLVGLVGGLVLLLAAPRAASQVAETVTMSPGRCLIVGGVAAVLMMALLAFSGKVMEHRGLIALVWTPITALLAIGSLLLLFYGWLAGMRVAGDRLARRFGFPGSGPLYWRIALGLTAFFLINVLVGGIFEPIGVCGLFLEFTLALMGLGAAVLTGLGNDPDWLAMRMRGEARWFGRRQRL